MTRFDVARTQQPKSTAAYGSLRFGPLRYQLKRTIGMLPTPDNSECSRQAQGKPLANLGTSPPNAAMTEKPDLESAYALQTPDDSRRLYAQWAKTYDSDFAEQNGYILHEQVARHFVNMGGFGPVLDVGAGTGLCGVCLRARGVEPVDGTDISKEMLAVAEAKGCYRAVFTGDVLLGLDAAEGTYQGVVSSGTFTHGHVGPDGIDAMMHVVRPRGWIVLSVNAAHFQAAGFVAKIAMLEPYISDLTTTEVPIYANDAPGEHARDTALLLAFRKAEK
ncbi:class I SAM-dependent DNA methyltransferase [Tateyamaria sp.]|uniref:class I SAM-dependent DNA methyltransferase n=1 Tax=Tateyamaria sp. TaxID=1929288 RepID=UPI003B21A2A6